MAPEVDTSWRDIVRPILEVCLQHCQPISVISINRLCIYYQPTHQPMPPTNYVSFINQCSQPTHAANPCHQPTNPPLIFLGGGLTCSLHTPIHPSTQSIPQYFTERTPGTYIEKKESSLTWHYRDADPNFGSWQARIII